MQITSQRQNKPQEYRKSLLILQQQNFSANEKNNGLATRRYADTYRLCVGTQRPFISCILYVLVAIGDLDAKNSGFCSHMARFWGFDSAFYEINKGFLG